ncbi:DUF748 domain-containing protein [Pelagicoccus albus]|uniref:DUF748 domain-containing protein n=1 Tax=Pelagicoccus albus TaxID=415222 RepID=A0A7X1B8D5_9BACT|nr:DUF748 domain-containing protein [Pelagicoccus albus]MBC2607456.1 DUF748 domain-containing protein [Pelagicoccus albus]
MSQKSNSKPNWRKRILITGLVLFTLYLCFGIWGVPKIMISQIEKLGSEALGRAVTVEKATFNPFSFEAKLYGIAIDGKEGTEGDMLTIGKVSANPQLSSVFGTITVKSVIIEDGDLSVEKLPSGDFDFQDILDTLAAAPVEEEEEESGELVAAVLRTLQLSNFNLHYADSSLATPYHETVKIVAINGQDIGTVPNKDVGSPESDVKYHWDFDVQIETESGANFTLNGGATAIDPWAFEVQANLAEFPLASAQPYVDESAVIEVVGSLGFDITAKVDLSDEEPKIVAMGSMSVGTFSARDAEQTFAAFEAFNIDGISIDANTMALSVDSIEMLRPVFSAILLENGEPRLPVMKEAPVGEEVAESNEDGEEPETSNFSASIAKVSLVDGHVDFEDRSLQSPFQTAISGLQLNLSDLEADQTEEGYDASGALSLVMQIFEGSIEMESKLESLEGLGTTHLKISNLQLSPAQNYVSEFAHAKVMDGILFMDIEAQVQALGNPVIKGSLGLENLNIKETLNDREVFAMQSLSLQGIDIKEESISLELIELGTPRLTVWQNEQGDNLSRLMKIQSDAEESVEAVEESTGMKVAIGKLQLNSAGIEFVDTTLVSTQQSHLQDFDLTVENVSTDPDKIADFSFEGRVDGAASLTGSGKVIVADPEAYMDLGMKFKGYDLVGTSPYWETYLGRSVAKGQFEIDSTYEIRKSQLKGTNSFKIDQLTLGQKVESERAINLPLGFAMKLLKDPSGMIAYPNLRVEGDLTDPQVKPWGLIGKAVRNLILNAVASPFKFLAGMVGGREDLDTIAFSTGSVELDEVATEKIDALRQIMLQRPGLSLELAFKSSPEEIEFLEQQFDLHRIISPDYQPVSGVDLISEIEDSVLKEAVEREYVAGMETREPVVSETGVEDEGEPVAAETAKKDSDKSGLAGGVFKKITGVLGLGKDEDKKQESASEEVTENEAPEEAAEPTEPSYEEKLQIVHSELPEVEFQSRWVADVANERILRFKQALLEDGSVENNRVFATELSSEDEKKPAGSLIIKLSE